MEDLVRKDRITGKLQNYNDDGIFMTFNGNLYLPIQLKIDDKWKFAYRCLTSKGIETFTNDLARITGFNILTFGMEPSIRFKYRLSDLIIDNHISKHVYDTMTFEYDNIPCRLVNTSQVIFGGKYKDNTQYLQTESILFSDDDKHVTMDPMNSMVIDRQMVNEYLDYYNCKNDVDKVTSIIESDHESQYWKYQDIDTIISLIKKHYKYDQDLMNVKLLKLLNKSNIDEQRKYFINTYSNIYYDYFIPIYNDKKLDNVFFERDSFDRDNPDDIMNLIYTIYKYSGNDIDNILFNFDIYIMRGIFSMLNKIAKLPSYRDMSILRFVNNYKVAISFIIPDNED